MLISLYGASLRLSTLSPNLRKSSRASSRFTFPPRYSPVIRKYKKKRRRRRIDACEFRARISRANIRRFCIAMSLYPMWADVDAIYQVLKQAGEIRGNSTNSPPTPPTAEHPPPGAAPSSARASSHPCSSSTSGKMHRDSRRPWNLCRKARNLSHAPSRELHLRVEASLHQVFQQHRFLW